MVLNNLLQGIYVKQELTSLEEKCGELCGCYRQMFCSHICIPDFKYAIYSFVSSFLVPKGFFSSVSLLLFFMNINNITYR